MTKKHYDSKLQLEQALIDYIQSRKSKKNPIDDHSTCNINLTRIEDSNI
jgi:hypothetical protein